MMREAEYGLRFDKTSSTSSDRIESECWQFVVKGSTVTRPQVDRMS